MLLQVGHALGLYHVSEVFFTVRFPPPFGGDEVDDTPAQVPRDVDLNDPQEWCPAGPLDTCNFPETPGWVCLLSLRMLHTNLADI
jgi:hypothetical protein